MLGGKEKKKAKPGYRDTQQARYNQDVLLVLELGLEDSGWSDLENELSG